MNPMLTHYIPNPTNYKDNEDIKHKSGKKKTLNRESAKKKTIKNNSKKLNSQLFNFINNKSNLTVRKIIG